MSESTSVDDGHRWECPACGGVSACCYRCQECGFDFASDGSTAARTELGQEEA